MENINKKGHQSNACRINKRRNKREEGSSCHRENLQCPWLVLMGRLAGTTSHANVGNEIKPLLQSTSSMAFKPTYFCQTGVKPSCQLCGPGNPKSNTDLIDNQKVED